jgi:hypothetical protein
MSAPDQAYARVERRVQKFKALSAARAAPTSEVGRRAFRACSARRKHGCVYRAIARVLYVYRRVRLPKAGAKRGIVHLRAAIGSEAGRG